MNMLAVGLLGFVVTVVTSAAPPSWIQAQDAHALSPLMTPASRVGLAEAEALGEFLVPMVTATAEQPAPDCWAEFVVSVPTDGAYDLWARVRFPAGADESFRISLTNAAADASGIMLGAGTGARHWHWVNSGRIELPAGLYVDGLTPHVCFCEHCRAKWRGLFGSEMPVAKLGRISTGWAVWAEFGRDPQPVGDVENDPDARQLTEMMHRSLVEVTHEFSRTVKQAKPDAVTLFHSHPKPGTDDAYDGTL